MLAHRHDGEKEGIQMATFKIKVKEIREGSFDIDADTLEEAQEKGEKMYWDNPAEYDSLLEPNDTFIEAEGPMDY